MFLSNKAFDEVLETVWNILEHPEFPFVSLTSTTNGARNFPPYNIIEDSDTKVRLEMAVAGYSKDRILVQQEGNRLWVRAITPTTSKSETVIRHRGISNADFFRTFELNPRAVVENVELKDGILTVTVTTKKQETPTTTFQIN